MKKTDLLIMIYQFIMAGIVFFLVVMKDSSISLTGKIIYPLRFIGIYLRVPNENFIYLFVLFLGILGLMVQREIYLRQQIKKAIQPYKNGKNSQ